MQITSAAVFMYIYTTAIMILVSIQARLLYKDMSLHLVLERCILTFAFTYSQF
jgi:hypothetical protein